LLIGIHWVVAKSLQQYVCLSVKQGYNMQTNASLFINPLCLGQELKKLFVNIVLPRSPSSSLKLCELSSWRR